MPKIKYAYVNIKKLAQDTESEYEAKVKRALARYTA